MARLIMAGVATVDMFDGDKLFGSATTLTESSLNIGISAEDVRGGEGAGLLGRYFHTSTFELTLTDALFNMEYIAKSVGAEVQAGADVMMNEQLTAASNSLTLSKTPVPMGCGDPYVWYRGVNEEAWTAVKATGKTITVPADGKYCVKYFYTNAAASKIRIASDYVPATLRLVLKENLYAAGETNNSQTKVGYVLINIPRFQLDGSQELSMSMTGASTTSLKGMALISDGCDAGCEGAGYYADMIQVLDAAVWYDGIIALAVDGGKVASKEDAKVYAIYNGKTPKLITDDMLVDGVELVIPDQTGEVKLTKDGNVIASGAIVIGA
jgi:predicted peroxiredoxin